MATDNRTLLNGAENENDAWAGDDTANNDATSGSFYEGSQGLSTQLSNSQERMVCSTIGGTRDLSDATVWFLVKDNLVQNLANGGFQIVLDDGSNEIGFYVNGNDSPPLQLPTFFNSLRLDVSEGSTLNGASRTNAYSGSFGSLAEGSITGVGYGTEHLAKAVGSIDNVFMDASYFIVNGNPAMTINGGTSGTPETFADVVADDIAGGWGMISNLQGDKFDINGSWEWGDSTATDSYFEDSNFQLFIDARDVGSGNFTVSTIAGSGTNSLVLTSGVIINIGTPANWDLSAALEIFELTSMTFSDAGTILFPAAGGTSRFVNSSVFNNCDQINFQDLVADGDIFNGALNADGAVVWTSTADPSAQDNFTFNSDGDGHAIHINIDDAGANTYNLDGYLFDGFAGSSGTAGDRVFFIENPSDGDITINLSNSSALNIQGGGDGFSFELAAGTTSSVTINATFTVTITVLDENGNPVEGARVRVEETSGGALVTQGESDASGVYTDNVSVSPPLAVTVKVRLKGFKNFRTTGTITSNGQSVGVRFVADTIVDLP